MSHEPEKLKHSPSRQPRGAEALLSVKRIYHKTGKMVKDESPKELNKIFCVLSQSAMSARSWLAVAGGRTNEICLYRFLFLCNKKNTIDLERDFSEGPGVAPQWAGSRRRRSFFKYPKFLRSHLELDMLSSRRILPERTLK